MADQLQLRRGTTAQIAAFTGAQGEVIVDTDKDTLVVQDGVTAGGFPLASESAVVDGTFYFNDDVSGGSIADFYILSPKANTNIPTSYMDGQQFGFVTANANTGPSTATFSALGVRSLKWPGGIDPVAGEISGRVYLIFDAANNWFEIQDIERSFDYLNTVRTNVASTATVDLVTAAPNTRHINITGTTAITAFTVAVGQTYFVRFAGALTLTNNAGIVTQSGANIVTRAGDTCIIRATAANVVEVLSYAPSGGWANSLTADGYQKLPSGLIIQWGRTTDTASTTFPITFPTAALAIYATFDSLPTASQASTTARILSTSTFSASWGAVTGDFVYWLAIGY